MYGIDNSVLMMRTRKSQRRLVEPGDDLLVRQSDRVCRLEHLRELSAIARHARRIGLRDELQFLVEINVGANVFAGRNGVEHGASASIWLAPETIVSMPGLDCAG